MSTTQLLSQVLHPDCAALFYAIKIRLTAVSTMACIVRGSVPGLIASFATTLPTAVDTALLPHFK
jgi:hypothetical protein